MCLQFELLEYSQYSTFRWVVGRELCWGLRLLVAGLGRYHVQSNCCFLGGSVGDENDILNFYLRPIIFTHVKL